MTKLIKTKNHNDCNQYLLIKDGNTDSSIIWQTGTEKEQGVNGLQLVDIIIMAIERLTELDPELSENENERTLAGLLKALIAQIDRDGKTKTLTDYIYQMFITSSISELADADMLEPIKKLYDYEVIEDDVK